MANKIKESDIFDGQIFEKNLSDAKEYVKTLETLIDVNKKVLASQKIENAKDIEKTNDTLTKSAKLRELNQRAKEKERIAEIRLQQAREKAFDKYEKQLQKQQAEEAKALKSKTKILTAYQQESKRLNDLRNQYKNLVLEGKGLESGTLAILKEVQSLDKKLKELDATTGQYQREVGNYKQSISEALKETSLFGGVINKIEGFVAEFEAITGVLTATQAKNVVVTEAETVVHAQNATAIEAETVATNQLSLAKRALNAITSPVGLLLLAGTAILALTKAVYDLNQSLQDIATIAKAVAKDALPLADGFEKSARASIKFRDEVRRLNLQLQNLILNEQDFTEISNDQTISLTERNQAFEEALKFRERSAQKALEIVRREKELIDLEITANESIVGRGNALAELYDKQNEALRKVIDAEDELGDLERVNAQERRQRQQQRLIQEIELLRSNKLSANVRVLELKKEIANEKKQLEEREKFVEELSIENQKTLQEEFRLFQKGVKEKIDFQDLVNTKDEVQLANKIKTNIASIEGTELETTLAKIIKQAQDAQIEKETEILKLKEERILRTQKIAQIERDIANENRERNFNQTEEDLKNKIERNEKAFKEQLEQENLFSLKLEKGRLLGIEREKELEERLYKEKQTDRDLDKANEILNNELTENDLLIRKAKEEEINNKYSNLELDAKKEYFKKLDDIEKKAEKQREERQKQQIIRIADVAKDGFDIFKDELDKQTEAQQEAFDKREQQIQKDYDRQLELANNGQKNILADVEARRVEAELQRKQAEEREQKRKDVIALGDAFFQAYINNLKQPNTTSEQALLKATKQTGEAAAIKTIIGGFFSAKDGAEDTGAGGNVDKDRGFLAVLHPHERVLTKEQNEPLLKMGIPNEILPNLVMDGLRYNSMPFMMQSLKLNQTNKELISEIRELKDVVSNKPYYIDTTDKHGNHVRTTVEGAMRRTVKYVTQRPRI